MKNQIPAFFALFIIANRWPSFNASCYFPQEYQGEFVMQSTASVGSGSQYSTLNITENSIPILGNCHRRIGNKFILMDNIGETSCVRCLHLKLRSSNVLQVFISSQQTISQCFINEQTAETNCPSEESLFTHATAEILFFKTRDAAGTPTTKEYCPIDGKYSVNYRGTDTNTLSTCGGFNSSADSCPSGSTMNFRLRSCSFENSDLKFECLGHWKGPNDENFLIFTDSRYSSGKKPKYRCAIYKHDQDTGNIDMALSSDSTCTTDLVNATSGYETFRLIPKKENPWPIEAEFSMCTFPTWMRGNWEHVRVEENKLIYKDHSSLKTYTIKCVVEQEEGGSKYLIFSRTQCNEERWNCMRIAKRSENILEFQLGTNSSINKDFFPLCEDENFQDDSWITQGRLDTTPEMIPGKCPITGEYTGMIPDATNLCAKLWSDCRAPALMYYQVSHCESSEVYEEREYQCLGHWQESELLYTYTQRRDIAAGTYECFVGSIISDKEINIKEAGAHCQRHIDPLLHGMKLTKKQHLYSCITRDNLPVPSTGIKMSTAPTVPKITPPSSSTRKTTMKHWNFDNTIPNENEKANSANFLQTTVYLYICLYILKLYL